MKSCITRSAARPPNGSSCTTRWTRTSNSTTGVWPEPWISRSHPTPSYMPASIFSSRPPRRCSGPAHSARGVAASTTVGNDLSSSIITSASWTKSPGATSSPGLWRRTAAVRRWQKSNPVPPVRRRRIGAQAGKLAARPAARTWGQEGLPHRWSRLPPPCACSSLTAPRPPMPGCCPASTIPPGSRVRMALATTLALRPQAVLPPLSRRSSFATIHLKAAPWMIPAAESMAR